MNIDNYNQIDECTGMPKYTVEMPHECEHTQEVQQLKSDIKNIAHSTAAAVKNFLPLEGMGLEYPAKQLSKKQNHLAYNKAIIKSNNATNWWLAAITGLLLLGLICK